MFLEPAISLSCGPATTVINNMSDRDERDGNGGETPDSAAHYIATMTEELALLARRNGLETLGYILDMARLEADQNAKG